MKSRLIAFACVFFTLSGSASAKCCTNPSIATTIFAVKSPAGAGKMCLEPVKNVFELCAPKNTKARTNETKIAITSNTSIKFEYKIRTLNENCIALTTISYFDHSGTDPLYTCLGGEVNGVINLQYCDD